FHLDRRRSCCACVVRRRLDPSASVYRNSAANVRSAALDELAALSRPAETQVLTRDYFRYRETIVDLGHVDVLRLHISHLVGFLRSLFCGIDGREAVTLMETECVLRLH